MKKRLIIFVLLFALTGCATTIKYDFGVSGKSVVSGLPEKHKCYIQYLNDDNKTIDGRKYAAEIEKMLWNKGFAIVSDKNKADCVIGVLHATNYGTRQKTRYTWGQTGVASSTSFSNSNFSAYSLGNNIYGRGSTITSTTYTPTYGITGAYTYDIPIINIGFAITGIDKDTDEEKWNLKIVYSENANSGVEFLSLIPIFKCIISHFLFYNVEGILSLTDEEVNQIYSGACDLVMIDHKN